MYGPPRHCKAGWSGLTNDSLRKCIRPLASELLLQPGHDEIHTHRSHKAGSGTKPAFSDRAYGTLIRCLVITPRTSQSVSG
jgi:hypothetical protein